VSTYLPRTEDRNPIVIEAGRADQEYWRDLWRHRELLYFLASRDIAVRYRQTVIGVTWVLVRPLVTALAFTLIFSRIANLPSEGAPYSLLVFASLLPWYFFASGISESSASLVVNSNLVSKVYFPRLVVPLSAFGTAFVDLLVTFVVLLLLMTWLGVLPSSRVLALPLFITLAMASALGLGLWFSALNARYRDVQHVVPLILQLGLYLSPIGFVSTLVPERWRPLFILNPMVGPIEGFRWSLLDGNFQLRPDALFTSAFIGAVLLSTGLWFFRRTERSVADVI
jgi:lipopolysaccharide transport system permease protein